MRRAGLATVADDLRSKGELRWSPGMIVPPARSAFDSLEVAS
jgi:hypothetical protein